MATKKSELQYVISGAVNSKFHKAIGTVEKGIRKLNRTGSNLTRNVTLPLIAAGTAAFAFATKFNAGMADVASLMPQNTARVAELKRGIQELSPVVGKTTDDLSKGLYQVISAFGDTNESLLKLKINAKAATAGVSQTEDAINLTSAVTKAYGDTSAKAVQKASDLALLTVRLGQTTFPQLAESVGRVTPLSKALGVRQEELFGVMATATGVTGKAAEVSTQFRGVLQSLMSPTEDMSKLLKKLGYANGEALIKSKGLKGTIDIIVQKAKSSGQPLQKYISSIEGQTIALALAGAQSKDFANKTKAMYSASGTTEQAFKAQTQGVNKAGFALKQVTAKGEVMAQKFGDALAPALLAVFTRVQPLVNTVSSLADKFAAMSPQGQNAVLIALGIAAATGPAIKGIAGFASGVKTSIVWMKAFYKFAKLGAAGQWIWSTACKGASAAAALWRSTVMSAAVVEAWFNKTVTVSNIKLKAMKVSQFACAIAGKVAAAAQWLWNAAMTANPIGLIIAGVAALVAGIYLLIKNWDKVKAATVAAWHWLVTFSTKGPGRFIPVTAMLGLIVKNWDKIKVAAKSAWDTITGGIKRALAWMEKVWAKMKQVGKWMMDHSAAGFAFNTAQKIAGRRASGGPVSSGNQYLVGERGPELFMSRRSGYIMPNHQLAASGGGITVNLTINTSGNGGNVESGLKQGTDYLIRELRKLARDEERRSFA